MNLDNLMFRREHFPIILHEVLPYRSSKPTGKSYYDFNRIEIPPFHPSMLADGIPFANASELVDLAVLDAVKDLEEIMGKVEGISLLFGDLEGKNIGEALKRKKVSTNDFGTDIEDLPVFYRVFIGRNFINPYSSDHYGNGGLIIDRDPEERPHSFTLQNTVNLPDELMREYEMTNEGSNLNGQRIGCTNLWRRHNLGEYDAIFYKNLVIALNNFVVRKKYHQETEEQRR